ncbi:MAG: DUF4230 domain-containing protein [Bacteroidota bacterium]
MKQTEIIEEAAVPAWLEADSGPSPARPRFAIQLDEVPEVVFRGTDSPDPPATKLPPAGLRLPTELRPVSPPEPPPLAPAVAPLAPPPLDTVPVPPAPLPPSPVPLPLSPTPQTERWNRYGAIALLVLFLAGALLWGYSLFPRSAAVTLTGQFEGIRRVEQLRLVRHTYLEIIPFTSGKKNRLEFLVEAPAHIYGTMDMSRLEYREEEGKLVQLTLPSPELSEVSIDLENIRETTFRGKRLSLTAGAGSFGRAYQAIVETLDRTKASVRESAVRNGILEDTRTKGRTFLTNQLQALGYRVQFAEADAGLLAPLREASSSPTDSTAQAEEKLKKRKRKETN